MSRRRPHHAPSGAAAAPPGVQAQAERDAQAQQQLDALDTSSVRSTSTQASTIATTASLASRLAVLNIDFASEREKPGGPGDLHSVYEASILEGSESAFDEDGDGTERGADDDDPHDRASQEDGAQGDAGGVPLSIGAISGVHHSPLPRVPPFQVCAELGAHAHGGVALGRHSRPQRRGPLVLRRRRARGCSPTSPASP